MNNQIKNPYGDKIEIWRSNHFFMANGRNGEKYISDEVNAVICAFINDVYHDGQIFTCPVTYVNFVAKIGEKQTKQNEGKNVYLITRNKEYLT